MSAVNGGETLLRVADQLCAELGYTTGADELGELSSALAGGGEQRWGLLGPEEESLIAEVRRSLAKMAAAGAAMTDRVAENGLGAALDWAELVMRGKLTSGDTAHLPALLPSFVFLVMLPIVGQDEALRISKRAAELTEEILGN